MSDSELGLAVKAAGRFSPGGPRTCTDAELTCVVSGSGKVEAWGYRERLHVDNQATQWAWDVG